MKKILISFVFVIMLFCQTFAKDIVPTTVNLNQINSIGLYQVSDDIKIYSEPKDNAQILYRIRWNNEEFFPEEIGAENFFTILLTKKSLGLIEVIDIDEDWAEVVYDKKNAKTGWIKIDDPYKFMTWINFYNIYGKKYGLMILKNSLETCKEIKSSTDENSQTISTINMPQRINLNVIRGNWALVSVLDLDKIPKTGYIRWRSDDGIRYYFPDLR